MATSPASEKRHGCRSLNVLMLLLGVESLPVVGKTDDLVTSYNVDVQVWFAITIAIVKGQPYRYKVFPVSKQTGPDVNLGFHGVSPGISITNTCPLRLTAMKWLGFVVLSPCPTTASPCQVRTLP